MAQAPRKADSVETQNTSSSSSNSVNSNNNTRVPSTHKWAEDILKNNNIKEYDPAILDMLHNYAYRYVSIILKDSVRNVRYRTEEKSDIIEQEDVSFAQKEYHRKTQYSPNIIKVLEDAAQVNRIPLPFVSHHHKLKLPPKPYRVTKQNFHLTDKK